MVACTYLAQVSQAPVSLPLQVVYKKIQAICYTLEKQEKEPAAPKEVLAILPPFGRGITLIEVAVQKVKIKAIVDTESPDNVVSSKLMKKLKFVQDLIYNQSYGKLNYQLLVLLEHTLLLSSASESLFYPLLWCY
ncbi:hypothetical protein DSO57_1024301 [Entomophthora muscae]|uniref:Uncharacterized protein n=1 Tax=Entomophthora muscae TaxID=34485 RepID=A0ACC2SF94_9FUNG|nr:hypothetical protein DSO57_1024301 [Entomophthora muscae]